MTSVTPGLVCAHHHLYSELARGMPPTPKVATNFQEILEQLWWRLDAALDLDMLEWSAKLGALEALESGTTAIIDHNESPNAIEGSLSVIQKACEEVGVRVLTCYGVTDRHGEDGGQTRPRGEPSIPGRRRLGHGWCARLFHLHGRISPSGGSVGG